MQIKPFHCCWVTLFCFSRTCIAILLFILVRLVATVCHFLPFYSIFKLKSVVFERKCVNQDKISVKQRIHKVKMTRGIAPFFMITHLFIRLAGVALVTHNRKAHTLSPSHIWTLNPHKISEINCQKHVTCSKRYQQTIRPTLLFFRGIEAVTKPNLNMSNPYISSHSQVFTHSTFTFYVFAAMLEQVTVCARFRRVEGWWFGDMIIWALKSDWVLLLSQWAAKAKVM